MHGIKQQDIALLLVVAFISAVLSFFVSGALFSSPKNRNIKVEVVQPISAEFAEPDGRYFNENSVNPTQLIRILENANQAPF